MDASSLTLGEGGGYEKEAQSEGVAVEKLFAAEWDHIESLRKWKHTTLSIEITWLWPR